jgi:hypothetical protein
MPTVWRIHLVMLKLNQIDRGVKQIEILPENRRKYLTVQPQREDV